jgi:DNA-binding transcriptional LysR family regulator
VRALEDALGRPLFEREGRGLRLTPAGENLRDAAGGAFAELARSWERLRRNAEAPLVLGCPGSLLARWVIPRLEKLQRQMPELKLHLAAHEGEFAPALPGLDAALMIDAPPWPTGTCRFWPGADRPGLEPATRTSRRSALPPDALASAPRLQVASRPQAWPQGRGPWIDAGPRRRRPEFRTPVLPAGSGHRRARRGHRPRAAGGRGHRGGRLAAPWGFTATGGQWLLAAPHGEDRRIALLGACLAGELADTEAAAR